MCIIKLLTFLSIALASCKGSNILLLNGIPSKSHFIWSRPIINALVAYGHNVTILSVDIDTKPRFPANTHYYSLEKVYPTLYDKDQPQNDISKRSQENAFQSILSYYHFGYLACKGAVASDGFKNLLDHPKDSIDLVIYDFTIGPCLLGFLQHFGSPPLVSITAFGIPHFSHNLVSGAKSYSTVPHFALSYSNQMSFDQRIVNFLAHSFDQFYRSYVFLPRIQKLIQPMFPMISQLSDLERNTQIMLTNSNPHVNFDESLPHSVIPVGGLQIAKPKNLPQDFQTFVETAKNGFILFSFGTNVKRNVLGNERFKMFYSALSQIKDYNFLWKLDGNDQEIELASNVKIVPWLPQTDLLGHNNIRAFITHCGLLSMQEAYWFGVPIVGIPIYVDQHRNCFKAELDEVGKRLDFNELHTELIRNTILEVLNNVTYSENMKAKSKLFRDQKEMPLARAIWWIEYVLRNPGKTNQNRPNLNFFQSHSFDVVLTLISTIVATIGLACFVVRKLVKFLPSTEANNTGPTTATEGKKPSEKIE